MTVLAGSFLGNLGDYDRFRKFFKRRVNIYMVLLAASKKVRDRRRIERDKPSTRRLSDMLDEKYPQDTSLASARRDYAYLEIDNSKLSIRKTIEIIKASMPDIFR